ncbi:MAG: tetratricopeptide repeat protein [Flavobacteriaceae bacterium]
MKFLCSLLLLVSVSVFSQSEVLAREYFKNGDFEKALYEYKKVYAQSSSNVTIISQIVATHQELEQYAEAEAFLLKVMERIKYPSFFVELGYNYQLKGDANNANLYYDKAFESIEEQPNYVFSIARSFQLHTLLNEAVKAYETAMQLKPDLNFNYQLAQLYGEQGNIEGMFNKYIDFIETNPTSVNNVKRAINDFISEDGTKPNNLLFKKVLLKKIQQNPDLIYNELLSWLFIQQKEFGKAFMQEKAIFNRNPESLYKIAELALIAVNEGETEIAKTIFTFIIETSQDKDMALNAEYHLLELQIKENDKKQYAQIESKYKTLFEQYGLGSPTLNLQIAYARFLAFYKTDAPEAISFLEKSLELPLTEVQKAQIKLQLGDILVLQEQFNKALIYYTQIQRNLKNSTLSQEARYKVAKASYYKGDFKWAESQLKVLKSSTSQLIANDALDLKLLISDNKYSDSLQTALKQYAKADLLAFQNKNTEAITVLSHILETHKTEDIIPQALFKQAQLFEIENQYDKAATNYKAIIDNYSDGVLIDDALFNLANLYETKLNQPEEAKTLYEQIIFNHADSIYFIDARKRFRALRGDTIN